jgi:hypothetical protein
MAKECVLIARPPITARPIIVLRVGDVDQLVSIDFTHNLELGESLVEIVSATGSLTISGSAIVGRTVTMLVDAGDTKGRFPILVKVDTDFDNRHVGKMLIEVL